MVYTKNKTDQINLCQYSSPKGHNLTCAPLSSSTGHPFTSVPIAKARSGSTWFYKGKADRFKFFL